MDALRCRASSIITPAFPENARTVFKGHLFVGDVLLSDSVDAAPSADADDRRQPGARAAGAAATPQRGRRVGLIDYRVVAQGAAAIGQRIEALRAEGVALAIVDALERRRPAPAGRRRRRSCRWWWPARAWPSASRRLHGLQPGCARRAAAAGRRPRAVVSGSCSAATNAQVAAFIARRRRGLRARPAAAGRRATTWSAEALAWARPLLAHGPGAGLRHRRSPTRCTRCSSSWAPSAPARWWSRRCRASPSAWSKRGVGQLVVAGGETSGACVQALGITQLRIGPQIDPGVPWCHAATPQRARRAAPGAEVRQLRRQRFLQPRLRSCCERRSLPARGDLPRRPLAVRARLRACHAPATSACGSTTAS